METRLWHYCIVISYIAISYSIAKPFSLNKILAAELDQKQIAEASTSKIPDNSSQHFTFKSFLKPRSLKSNILREADASLTRFKKLSPLKYRKTFEIKAPLKPKKIKRSPKSKYKRKNQSIKREINGNGELNQKYIPLLKSIGMLFDNLLTDDSGAYEIKPRKYKRNRYDSIFSEQRDGLECTCTQRSNNENSKSAEATVAVETPTTEISIDSEDVTIITTTTETTHPITSSDVSSVRYNQNVPLLFPRDTTSSWGNDNGVSERSSSTYHWSVEGNFTGNYGNSEHSTGFGQNEPTTKNGNEIASNATRISASGDGSHERRRRNGNNTRSANPGFTSIETNDIASNEDISKIYGHLQKYKRQDKLEMGRDKTESSNTLSELIRRLRGYVSEIEVTTDSYTLQPEKIHKESIFNVAHDNTSNKRFPDRSSANTEKVKTVSPRNETMTLTKTSTNFDRNMLIKSPPVVMIIDGYSVTRHKNGENKLAKKAIHIHS